MEQDGKTKAERAQQLRKIAEKIMSLSDEELEKAVGGTDISGRSIDDIFGHWNVDRYHS